MRKRKGKVQNNGRVRFCSLDYYKTLATDIQSKIDKIKTYYVDENQISVNYENGFSATYDVSMGDKQLKQVIKIINAYLGGTGNGTQQQ